MLSVKQLCEKANISQQTFYRLIRDSKEFSALVEQNRQRKSNGYRYDTPVLKWLLSYYERENASEPPAEAPDTSSTSALEAERDALRVELEALLARFDAVEAERKELLAQNGRLLLLLSQEKQEKQALLPPPRVPLVERIKAIFKKEQG